MLVLLFFSFVVGMLSTLAPCIWPVLPIIFSGAISSKKHSLGMIFGILLTLFVLTISGSSFLKSIAFQQENRCLIASLVVGLVGITMLFPPLITKIEFYLSLLVNKLGIKAKTNYEKKEISFWEGLIKGTTLGVVWTPCSAPLAGSVITFSARSIPFIETFFLNLAYVAGFAVPLLMMFLIGEKLVQKSKFVLVYHEHIQRFIGLFMILIAIAVCTHFDKVISSRILDLVPNYSILLDKVQMRIM